MSRLDSLKAALAEQTAAETAKARAGARAAELRAKAETACQARAQLEETAAARDAEAMVAGRAMPEAPLSESRQLAKLAREARAAAAAAQKEDEERTGPLAERQREAEAAVMDHALATFGGLREAARGEIHSRLESIVPHMGMMIATQRLRDYMCGPSFEFDSTKISPADLYDGALVVRKLVESLPPRLRPQGFMARIEAAADAAFAKLLADLGETR